MPEPTFVAEYEVSAWNTNTTPKTVTNVSLNTGDVLVVLAASETNNAFTAPSGGGLTYQPRQVVHQTQYCEVAAWTAVAASATGNFTLSVGCAGGQQWGFTALKFSASDGVGQSVQANANNAQPSANLTPDGANSTIVSIIGDWNALSTSRTWRQINSITPTSGNGLETTYQPTGNYTVYVGRWNDAGVSGVAKQTGMTAPATQKYAIVSVEILGSAGGGATTVDSDLDVRWSVETIVNSDLDVRWSVANLIDSDLDVRWTVSNQVDSDLDVRWSVANQVDSDLDVRWSVANLVNSDLDVRWSVEGTTAQVDSDLDVRWSVATLVDSDLDARWTVSNTVSSDLDSRWSVANSVDSDLDVRWSVANLVSSDLTVRWNVDGVAPANGESWGLQV